MNQAVLKTIEATQAIPSAPHIVSRLLEITDDPDYRHDEVAKLLATDPGVASDVLRMANSALLGGLRKVGSISEAIVRLGIRQVRTLVIGRGMIDSIGQQKIADLDMSYFWRRSLATAVLSSRIAEELGRIPRDIAFTGGLLADIGIIVLARALPVEYAAILRQYAPRGGGDMIIHEIEHFGGSHADVSAFALQDWSVPADVVQAVRLHHDTDITDAPELVTKLARIINAAGEIARFLCEAGSKEEVQRMCTWAMDLTDLRPRSLQRVLKLVESDITELASALHVDVIPSKVYALIAQGMTEQLEATSS